MSQHSKTWWAPVWRGLVVDPEGKHYRRLKGALWLFLYLLLHADRKTGIVRHRLRVIASAMGISRWTVRDWLRRLRNGGYVAVVGTGRTPAIGIRRWRALAAGHATAPLRGKSVPVRGASAHSLTGLRQAEKPSEDAANPESARAPNESSLTRGNSRNGRPRRNFLFNRRESRVETREELLARDLAHGLQDHQNLPRYLAYARRYPESFLRQLLSEARAVPEQKLKRSRVALFTYLLNLHAKEEHEDPRR